MPDPKTIAAVITRCAAAQLACVPAIDADRAALAAAIGNGAAQVLSLAEGHTGGAISAAVSAARSIGAARLYVSVLPSGSVSVDITVDTVEAALELAHRLGMPEPRRETDGRHDWWESSVGEFGFDRTTITGGHQPLCQCHPRTGRAA